MAPLPNPRDVEHWLAANGWSPGCDIGARVDELVAVRVQDSAQQGAPLAPLDTATRFLHS
ncbi:SUKH-3 domain-containing protein [Kitasatospora sp. HPMI-4]|uniref:SUKH-3 domain-containing protein n=1 Tax=Kitasatospora sp. HPMI-4 TaxID=3448443 RepID=UPI003F1A7904